MFFLCVCVCESMGPEFAVQSSWDISGYILWMLKILHHLRNPGMMIPL